MDDKERMRQWEVVIADEALKHPFVMEGLLAMSALYLAFLRLLERTTWMSLALKHHNIALTSFRSTILDRNEKNCHTILALSILISVSAMAFTNIGTNLSPGELIPTGDITEHFTLIRGVREILGITVWWLIIGPLRSNPVGHVVNICQSSTPSSIAKGSDSFNKWPSSFSLMRKLKLC